MFQKLINSKLLYNLKKKKRRTRHTLEMWRRKKAYYMPTWVPLDTVKASNFGPQGNFGLFLTSSVAPLDESCTKNEQNRICRPEVLLQLLFSSFFCKTDAFHWFQALLKKRSKVRGFDGRYWFSLSENSQERKKGRNSNKTVVAFRDTVFVVGLKLSSLKLAVELHLFTCLWSRYH